MANTVEYIYEVLDRFSGPLKKLDQANARTKVSLDRVKSSAAQVRSQFASLAKFGAVAGAAVAGAGYAMFRVAKEAADLGDAAFKTSQKIGMEIEALQEVSWAAKLAGLEQAELNTGLRMLNVNMTEAARGSKEYLRHFNKIGLSAKDLRNMSMEEVLLQAADAFSKMEDGAEKTAAAVRIFGRSGASMIPLLNAGRAGLEAAAAEARELNIIFDHASGEVSERFNDNLLRLQTQFLGMRIEIGRKLIPILNELVLQFMAFIKVNREDIVGFFVKGIEQLRDNLPKIKKGISDTAQAVWKVIQAFDYAVSAVGGFGNAIKILAAIIALRVVVAVALLAKALFTLGVALVANPIGLIVLAIAGAAGVLAGAAYLIYENWGPIMDWFAERIDNLKKILFGLVKFVSGVFTGNWRMAWDGIKDVFVGFYEYVTGMLEGLLGIIGAVIGAAVRVGRFVGLGQSEVSGAVNKMPEGATLAPMPPGMESPAAAVAERRESQANVNVDGQISVTGNGNAAVEDARINLNGGSNLATAY
jgi:phage-related minor tail protein